MSYSRYNTYHAMDDTILRCKISFFTVIPLTERSLKVQIKYEIKHNHL